jgi:hypothetical protein
MPIGESAFQRVKKLIAVEKLSKIYFEYFLSVGIGVARWLADDRPSVDEASPDDRLVVGRVLDPPPGN